MLWRYRNPQELQESDRNPCISGIRAFPAESQITKEIIPMKLTWHGHSAFRIEAGAAKILIDPFLSANPSWDKGWRGYLAGKNSTQGGDR
jgi:hypothetical protein